LSDRLGIRPGGKGNQGGIIVINEKSITGKGPLAKEIGEKKEVPVN